MAAPLPESDADLVALALDGRQEAFSALYERYFPSIYDFLTRLLRDRDEAADVAQDTFIKAMEQLPTLEDPAKFKSWLFTIAHRRGLNRIRSSKRVAPGVAAAVDDDERATMAIADPDPAIDPERMAELHEAADLVWEAAAGLDPRTYTVMDLHVRHGLDSAEIADVMGVSKGNAYTMVSRMKDAFTATLGTYLVVRNASGECRELDGIVGDRGDDLTPQLRKRVDRHIRRCDICSASRVRLDPIKVFATLMLVPVPVGLQAGIWGSVAAGGATVGAATAAASGSSGAGSAGAGSTGAGSGSAGSAGAAGSSSGAAAASTGVAAASSGLAVGAAVAAGIVAVAVVGGIMLSRGDDTPPPTQAPLAAAPGDVPVVTAPPVEATLPPGTGAGTDADPAAPPLTIAPPTTLAPPPTTIPPPPTTTTLPPTTTTLPPTTTTTTLPPDPEVPGPGPVRLGEDGTFRFDPLAGASDPHGRELRLVAFDSTSEAGGTIVEGSLIYTPPPDFHGKDSFTYTVAAGIQEVVVRVRVTVDPMPDDPRPPAGDLEVRAREDTPVEVDGLAGWHDPDGGTLRLVAGTVETRRGGTARTERDGSILYTPPPDYSGSDRFTYRVANKTTTVTATAVVTVVPAPDAPRVADLTVSVAEDTAVGTVVGRLAIVEPDGEDYTVHLATDRLAVDGAGTVTVARPLDHEAAPLIVVPVSVTDTTGRTGSATLTVLVTDVNEAPTVEAATFTISVKAPPGTVVGRVSARDPDAGDTLSYTLDGAGGLFAVDGDGDISVAGGLPVGEMGFTVIVTDGGGLSASAPVTVTVEAEPGPTITDVTVDPDTIYRNAGDRECPPDARTTVLTAHVDGEIISARVDWRVVVDGNERSGTIEVRIDDDLLTAVFTLAGNTGGRPDATGTLTLTVVVTAGDGREVSAKAPEVTVLPCPG